MKFKVKFKSLSGDILIVAVNETDRIDNIKRNLSKIVKIKYENIGFLLKSQFLFNDKFVSDYRIGNDEIVVYFEYENCERYSMSDSVEDRLKELNINIDQGDNQIIEVFVKCTDRSNRTYSFKLPPRLKVSHLKQMLVDRKIVEHINSILLVFQGESLLDNETLDNYDICDGDCILLTVIAINYHDCSKCCVRHHMSILPINNRYDKLELYNMSDINEIIDKIHDRYDNIDKINIRLYRNADKTESIINNNHIENSVYYFIENEIDKYEICSKLGTGLFGIVFQCKEKSSNKIYAVKQFKISKENDGKINFEKQFARFLSIEKHERIIELIKQFNDIDSSYLLMEYIDQGSIGSIIMKDGALSETESAEYAQQILEGLEYLHIHRIIHGNINDSNILIDRNGNVKLSDFGLRTIFHNISNRNSISELLQSEINAINWLSPEIIRNGRLVPASDIWSFGAVVLEMITGQIPHYGLSVGQIIFSIMKGQIKFTFPQFYKDHIKSFISICLKAQPRERANFDDLYQHSFLK